VSEPEEKPSGGGSGSLAIPVIWGVGAGLFAAVLTRGVIAGGFVVVLALIVFGVVVLSAKRANNPQPRRRPAPPAEAPKPRRTGPPRPPRPPAAMTEAALEREGTARKAAPAQSGRRADWLSQAQKLAFGKKDDTQDDDASASKG
jgi:predicted lipid-binding transport protein (Tim44 family)